MLNAKKGILREVDMKNVMGNFVGVTFEEKVDYEIEFAGSLGLDVREVNKEGDEVELAFYKRGNEDETEVGFKVVLGDNQVKELKEIYSDVFEEFNGYDLGVINDNLNDRLFA